MDFDLTKIEPQHDVVHKTSRLYMRAVLADDIYPMHEMRMDAAVMEFL
jgi:hypothetical protein